MPKIIARPGFLTLILIALALATEISSQAATATAMVGKTVTLAVNLGGGTPPFSYQWYKDGTAIPGATAASFVIPSVQASAAGAYDVYVANAYGSTISDSGELRVVAAASPADLSGDGGADVLWENTATGDRAIWVLQGTAQTGSKVFLANVTPAWHMVGRGDFNGDGQPDIVWENSQTGDHAVWFLNGTTYAGNAATLPTVPAVWHIAAVADMNGDGHPDLVWENLSTGDRAIWYCSGTTPTAFAFLAFVDPAWRIRGAGDFNGDGHMDLVWECVAPSNGARAGDHVIWLMNGENLVNIDFVGYVEPVWRLAAVADYTGDGKPDLLWQDTTTGDPNAGARVFWEMTGTTFSGNSTYLGQVDPVWQIAP